jgi:hypothetical protein
MRAAPAAVTACSRVYRVYSTRVTACQPSGGPCEVWTRHLPPQQCQAASQCYRIARRGARVSCTHAQAHTGGPASVWARYGTGPACTHGLRQQQHTPDVVPTWCGAAPWATKRLIDQACHMHSNTHTHTRLSSWHHQTASGVGLRWSVGKGTPEPIQPTSPSDTLATHTRLEPLTTTARHTHTHTHTHKRPRTSENLKT